MASTIVAPCSYILKQQSGSELTRAEAEIKLENDRLSILPKFEEAIEISLVDIVEILPGDYKIMMTLSSGETLTVFDLGYKFEDFVSSLFRLRNEIILKYLLINESVKRSDIWGDLAFTNAAGIKKEFEKCEIKLYETSIVFMPRTGDFIRVHYGRFQQVEVKDYAISIKTEAGDQFTILRLGKEFDSTSKDLSDSINALNLQTQSLIKELAPSVEPSAIMALSRIMKDGRAARVQQINAIAPIIWSQFEKSLGQTPIWREYQYLQSIARHEKISIGIKRGLMGDLTGNYVWLLMPLYGNDHSYGNAIALEAARLPSSVDDTDMESASGNGEKANVSVESGGNATYFFRLIGRKEYSAPISNTNELDAKVDGIIQRISDLMMDVNFRREPILLSEERLNTEPKYSRYRYAVQKIPSLRELRQLFIGRVIHSSFDQWKSDVTELLKFNATANDDRRWEK